MIVTFGAGPTTLTGPIIDGQVLRQSFVAEGDFLDAVNILFSTYRRKNDGTMTIEVIDSRNTAISSRAIRAADLCDNSYHRFDMGVRLLLGSRYEIRIKTLHCRSGQSPTAHHAQSTHDAHLFAGNGLMRGQELACQFEYGGQQEEEEDRGVLSKDDATVVRFLREKTPLVSIIILNKDGRDLLPKCIESITDHVTDDYEIIIGDTGTKDTEILGFYEDLPDNVRVVGGLKYHFSKANNHLAKEHAQGEYLLFLNNDVFLESDALARMIDYARVFTVGAVGLRLMKLRKVIDHDGQVLFDKDGNVTTPDHLHVNLPTDMTEDVDGVTEGVTAACLLTRRDIFEGVGGFDEGYRDVYQDCDYCLKMAANGFSCVTVRSHSAIHVGSATRTVTEYSASDTTKDRKRFLDRWRTFKPHPTPEYSFITCCNNSTVYSGFMQTLPERGTDPIELVPINNNDNRLTVTQALNIGAQIATGKILVYCHQDIILGGQWVAKVSSAMSHMPKNAKVGMVGFEGIQDGGTPQSCRMVRIGTPTRTQTLDELCIMTRSRDLKFDEQFRFHYYGADICLQSEERGLKNFLIGVPIEHLSGGGQNVKKDPEAFKAEAQRLRDKWPYKDVWTTTTKFLDGGISYMILPSLLNT